MRKMLMVFFILFYTSSIYSKDHIKDHVKDNTKDQVAVCAIFNNDTQWIPQWVDFHIEQGIDHLYLYDNSSNDRDSFSEEYKNKSIITIIPWPYSYKDKTEWTSIQCSAYMDCIKRFGKKIKWMAFLDTDEFLFCPNEISLKDNLKGYLKYPGVCVNRIMYGTSDIRKIYPNEKMVDKLVYRAPLDFSANLHVKSIVQPKYVVGCANSHVFLFDHSLFSTTEELQPMFNNQSNKVSVNIFRINHYWTRDMDFFINKKIPMRKKWGFDADADVKMERQLNSVYDPILSR